MRGVVELWLHDYPAHTRRSYERDVATFIEVTGKRDLRDVTLADLHKLDDELRDRHAAPATIRRRLAGIKSLLTFANRLGLLEVNVGAAKRAPKLDGDPPDRILRPEEIFRLFVSAVQLRDELLIKVGYYGGTRPAELVRLRWGEVNADPKGRGVLHLHGKGARSRYVLVPSWLFVALVKFRGCAGAEIPVFANLGHAERPVTTRQVHRIVVATAERAGVAGDVSPQWLRHAHISHALDRGAPVHLVRESVGHVSLETTGRYAHARPDDGSSLYLPTL